MFEFHDDFFVPFMVFAVPVVAVAGGILAGIIKTVSAHRLMEAAVRERMALIARGMDPAKFPPPGDANLVGGLLMSLPDYPRYRAQGLVIGGIVTLAGSLSWLGVVAMLGSWVDGDWGIAVIAGSVGIALILSGLIIWPRGQQHTTSAPPRVG